MTALTTTAPTPAVPTSTSPARFRDLLAAEWLKLWSLRSMRWAFGVSALALVLLNANAALADYDNWPGYPALTRAYFVPGGANGDAFSNNTGIALLLVAGSLGAVSLVNEYATGLIRATFAAVPDRRALLTAKVAVLTAVTLVYGAVVALASFGVSEAILSGRHAGIPIDYPGALRGIVASALLAPVCALTGMGLGALIRHSATTIVATVVVLLLIPNFMSNNHRWSADLYNATPFRAWQRLRDLDALGHSANIHYPATVTGSWLVLALWPLVAVLLTLAVVHRRDL